MSAIPLISWGPRSLASHRRVVGSKITNFARPKRHLQSSPVQNHRRATPEMPESTATQPITANDGQKKTLAVKEVIGDIFAAPPNSVLIHACNCYGNWGAGIAGAFRQHYPNAHKKHEDFCKSGSNGMAQVGTAQLIPPLDEPKKHYVGNLFTSGGYGRRKDTPDMILSNTGPAMVDLLRQIADVKKNGGEVAELRICKINSGLFGVPWEKSLEVLQNIELEPDMPTEVTVYERA